MLGCILASTSVSTTRQSSKIQSTLTTKALSVNTRPTSFKKYQLGHKICTHLIIVYRWTLCCRNKPLLTQMHSLKWPSKSIYSQLSKLPKGNGLSKFKSPLTSLWLTFAVTSPSLLKTSQLTSSHIQAMKSYKSEIESIRLPCLLPYAGIQRTSTIGIAMEILAMLILPILMQLVVLLGIALLCNRLIARWNVIVLVPSPRASVNLCTTPRSRLQRSIFTWHLRRLRVIVSLDSLASSVTSFTGACLVTSTRCLLTTTIWSSSSSRSPKACHNSKSTTAPRRSALHRLSCRWFFYQSASRWKSSSR